MNSNARAFSTRLAELLSNERSAMVSFLLALADFDSQKLWAELGHNGLFAYLKSELQLSDGAAYSRMKAAELIRRFPAILEPLRDGRLCMTTLTELSKVITEENWAEVLPQFYGCSKRDAQMVRVQIAPEIAPPMRDVIVPLKPLRLGEVTRVATCQSSVEAAVGLQLRPGEVTESHAYLVRPDEMKPVTTKLFRVGFTASDRFQKKFERVRDELAHQFPGGDMEEIFEAGLDLLLEKAAKRRGEVKNPRPPNPEQQPLPSRQLPSAVKREVWKRDQGKCQWPLESGGICGETRRLQFDHKTPWALGGESTVEGTRLLCQAHNLIAAEQVFGADVMAKYRRSG
jgi:hypothetical protein